jgi:hypothetical protein
VRKLLKGPAAAAAAAAAATAAAEAAAVRLSFTIYNSTQQQRMLAAPQPSSQNCTMHDKNTSPCQANTQRVTATAELRTSVILACNLHVITLVLSPPHSPEADVKVVGTSAAPRLVANLSCLLNAVLAGACICYAHSDGLLLIPALRPCDVTVDPGGACNNVVDMFIPSISNSRIKFGECTISRLIVAAAVVSTESQV